MYFVHEQNLKTQHQIKCISVQEAAADETGSRSSSHTRGGTSRVILGAACKNFSTGTDILAKPSPTCEIQLNVDRLRWNDVH